MCLLLLKACTAFISKLNGDIYIILFPIDRDNPTMVQYKLYVSASPDRSSL